MPDTDREDTLFSHFRKKMEDAGLSAGAIAAFQHNYSKFLNGTSPYLSEHEIASAGDIQHYEALDNNLAEKGAELAGKTVVIKLNGGLGTSMGLEGAKSLLPARPGHTFLEIIARQTIALRERYHSPIPLFFMDSFRTEAETLAALKAFPELLYGQKDFPFSFLQNQVPKVDLETKLPISWPADRGLEWCPPGHGDIYAVLHTNGLLEELLRKGFEYAFLSNSDNLGAVFDPAILGFLAELQAPFLMEVADRQEADKKGGHLARSADGRLILRERAQCLENEIDKFEDITRYQFFNTNSIWLSLKALQHELVKSPDGVIDLPLIQNKKNVDPRDAKSPIVVQLETAMGAAISFFPGSQALAVPRSRFAPVKTTDNLLELWSDRFILDSSFQVLPNSARRTESLTVALDPRYYSKIDDFSARFPHGAPSLIECSRLEISGDVRFGSDVRISGRVRIKNEGPEQKEIADGSTITSDLTL